MNTTTNIYINTNSINNTNQKIYYSGNKYKEEDTIDSVFKYTNVVYNKEVIITTKDETITKVIIAKDNNSLITNMYEVIPIDNIISLKVLE